MTRADYWRLVAAAEQADDTYSAALQRTYGRAAGDARYDARGTATPELRALSDSKLAADARMNEAADATRHSGGK